MTAIKKEADRMQVLGLDRYEVDEVLELFNGDGALVPGLLSRIAKLAPDAQQTLEAKAEPAILSLEEIKAKAKDEEKEPELFMAEPLALVRHDGEEDDEENAASATEEEA